MPIKNRIDMLDRCAYADRDQGARRGHQKDRRNRNAYRDDLEGRQRNPEAFTRNVVAGGYFLDFNIKREALARYGLSVEDVQMVITSGHRRGEH